MRAALAIGGATLAMIVGIVLVSPASRISAYRGSRWDRRCCGIARNRS